ncbi:MAG: pyridoxamine 5'-phosphate oxidase family protein, partial [Candidatus Dormibacteraeota bacterium]|nr:pyridoxamine 5'-phosphate oxidase family protein [Candidatus Dormibacteraeota bacterium]
SWAELEAALPAFARRVRAVFDAHKHKTLATLRRDGSPRISGVEMEFADGDVVIGMMLGSVKVGDLELDPRLAVHSGTEETPSEDPSSWTGDAKIAGRALAMAEEKFNRFRIDITEVVLIRVGRPADHLVIESWHPDRGLTRRKRY